MRRPGRLPISKGGSGPVEGRKAEPCRGGQRSKGDKLQVSEEKVFVTQGFGLGREDNWIKPSVLWLGWDPRREGTGLGVGDQADAPA